MSDGRARLLVLREAAPEDAPLLRRIMLAAYEEYRDSLVPPSGAFDETVEEIRHAVQNGGAVIVEEDGVVIACGRFDFGPERAFIEVGRLSVLPAYRGRGIATRMLAWFEARAASLSVPEVRLGVRLNLPQNIALYERVGYATFDYEDRPGYGRIAAWMRKSVPRAPATEKGGGAGSGAIERSDR